MKYIYRVALCLVGLVSVQANAQNVDRSKYPDYDPVLHPDYSLMENNFDSHVKSQRGVMVDALPDHVNNADRKFFPPVFNQAGGSCSPASRICYMFTYELNAFRNADGSRPENQYPSHFVWLHTYGNSGKDAFVTKVGVPNVTTYGGRTYSFLLGNQDAADKDYGWMQGYEKWYSGMFNRMVSTGDIPSHLGTEEGRMALKRWLYNHNGDDDFNGAGGLAGIGVASEGEWKSIPNSPTNMEAGVVGKKFVQRWGTTFDHALTIVGYDDRIEFDLNGNGVVGEKSADEKGAWIIVNSWGGDWCNDGFIYCPYAYAGSTFSEVAPNKYQFDGNFWYPEVYRVRKNYRPLRTLKVKMDYSRRSEIAFSVGVSSHLDAIRPEVTVPLEYFKYAGDGNYGQTRPAPEVPMLGRWGDGKLHHEAMEFGYDLTDLSAQFDHSTPLKYFFIVNTKDWAEGHGKIYDASIIDYEFDRAGVEVPFNLDGKNVQIENHGKQTIISTVVYGESYYAPQNLVINETGLSWEKPLASVHQVAAYRLYRNNSLMDEVSAGVTNYENANLKSGFYAVSAVYEKGVESEKIGTYSPVKKATHNMVAEFKGSGFLIPNVFNFHYDEATIEYWIRPNSLCDWNQAVGPGWGDFMFHANAKGQFVCGWGHGKNRCSTPSGTLQKEAWTHIAIVVKNNTITVYANGRKSASVTSDEYSGIGGFGDLRFREIEDKDNQNAKYDEIRIWNHARTSEQILADKQVEYTGRVLPKGLLAYYKGDTLSLNGKPYLNDHVGGNHARILNDDFLSMFNLNFRLNNPSKKIEVSIDSLTQTVYVGVPVKCSASYSSGVTDLLWTAPGAQVKSLNTTSPTFTFTESGKQMVEVVAKNQSGDAVSASYEVEVEPAPVCDASFTLSKTSVPAGERVSFLAENPVLSYRYEWSMPGAEVEKATTINASTSFSEKGIYTVTLKVTTPEGKTSTVSHDVSVVEIAPVVDFEVSPAVIVKGETTFLKDLSKFAPTAWQWHLHNLYGGDIVVNGQNSSFTPEQPGVFDVTLNAKNSSGSDKQTRKGSLIVCNADSKNGLLFNGQAKVAIDRSPITTDWSKFTMDWWLNPSRLSEKCIGIGDSQGNFGISCNAEGALKVVIGKKHAMSGAHYIIPGEWHHYAVAYSGTKVYFYRDGVVVSQHYVGHTTIPVLKDFCIGGSGAPIVGQLDEFRIWKNFLNVKQIQLYANSPIEDVAAATEQNGLCLYYNFNQNGGDVQDATTNQYNGVRSGFGPDGDAWGLSQGVFCLNFAEHSPKQDVTNDYLTNFKAPFKHSSHQVNKTIKDRFYEISDWTLENATVKDGITTGVHVDAWKSNYFTNTTVWDDFSTVLDHKIYQTVTLPAGAYKFSAYYGDFEGECGHCYLAVAEGHGLPNTAEVESKSLMAKKMVSKEEAMSNSVEFVLTEDTEVSLGLVINQADKSCMTIKNFKLVRNEVTVLEADDSKGYDLVIGQEGLTTLCLPYPTIIPEGVTVYVATSVEDGCVRLSPVENGIVPAKTGVVVAADAGNYHFSPSSILNKLSSLLTGVLEDVVTDPGKRYYGLDMQPEPGFYPIDSNTLTAHKAYLVTGSDDSNAFYSIERVSVGIEQVEKTDSAVDMYDLSGRRVLVPGKGVYITEKGKVLVR